MRWRVALHFVAAALLIAACAHAQPVPKEKKEKRAKVIHDARTGIAFPQEIKHFERGGIHRYEEPGLGFSVPYQSASATVTVYVYDAGLKEIPDGIESKAVRLQFGKAKAEIMRAQRAGAYLSVRRLGDSEILLGSDTNAIPALKSTFEIAQKDQETLSVIVITARKNSFIKMRCTYPRYLKAQAEKSFESFLKEFSIVFQEPEKTK